MKSKLKKCMAMILLLFLSFGLISFVRADSGWDSSYDSGGSSWSSGDSWSSSSWDYDYGYDHDYDYDSSGDSIGIEGIISLIVLIIIIICIIKAFSNKELNLQNTGYNEISEDKVKEIFPDLNLEYLRLMAAKKFIDIQNAWMEFDYDALRELVTDELYNSYVSQLDILKLKNGKNIMNDFEILANKIIDIRLDNNDVTVKVFMKVRFYDYVIDTKTNKVTRGSSQNKITNNYEMTFVRRKNELEKDLYCPNCGAPIMHNTSGECEYCNSTIVRSAEDFVMSKKTNVN